MADFIPAPGIVKCVVSQVVGTAGPIVNVFHVGNPADPSWSLSPGNLETLANTVFDAWQASFLQRQSGAVTLESVTCTDLSAPASGGVTSTVPAAVGLGGTLYPMAPPGSAALVKQLVAGLSGRASHGKLYLCGLTTQHDIGYDGTVNASCISAVAGYLPAFNSQINTAWPGAALQFMRWHQGPPAGTPLPRGANYPVTNWVMESTFRNQRRRQTAAD